MQNCPFQVVLVLNHGNVILLFIVTYLYNTIAWKHICTYVVVEESVVFIKRQRLEGKWCLQVKCLLMYASMSAILLVRKTKTAILMLLLD